MREIKNLINKTEERIKIYLSHHPVLYALFVGIGVVLFWRGVWHTTDLVHTYFGIFQNSSSVSLPFSSWWDGPLSFVVGIIILFFTGAFTSSFIGNELILSGLRQEKKLSQKTEIEVESEEKYVSDIKEELNTMADKINQLEKKIHKEE
jgi:hypothetical protein